MAAFPLCAKVSGHPLAANGQRQALLRYRAGCGISLAGSITDPDDPT